MCGSAHYLQVIEMCELDGISSDFKTPASDHEILAALLGALQDAHWARAVDCRPEPGLMVPIDPRTASSGRVCPSDLDAFETSRALAAAERRTVLLPRCRWG
jgi:hypothetical protein